MGPRYDECGYGYATGHDMLWQLRNRAAGWVYWNVLLDGVGGPNLAGNYVDSPTFKYNGAAPLARACMRAASGMVLWPM